MRTWFHQHGMRWCVTALLAVAAVQAGSRWFSPTNARPSSDRDSDSNASTEVVRRESNSKVVPAQFSAVNPLTRKVESQPKLQRLPPTCALPPRRLPLVSDSDAAQIPPIPTYSVLKRPPEVVSQPDPVVTELTGPTSDLPPEQTTKSVAELPAIEVPSSERTPEAGVETLGKESTNEIEKPEIAVPLIAERTLPIAETAPETSINTVPEQNEKLSEPVVAQEKFLAVTQSVPEAPPLLNAPTRQTESPAKETDPLAESAVPTSPPAAPENHRLDWNDKSSGLSDTARQAEQLVRDASALARRGATYSARRKLENALIVLAQGLDSHLATANFTRSLRSGLLALEEIDDFTPSDSRGQLNLEVALIVSRHRSGVISREEAAGMMPGEAARKYSAFILDQLATASGDSPIAAQALFGLGKLYTNLAVADPATERRLTQRAMLMHQAALRANSSHSGAGTELASLLIRAGRLRDARDVLQRGLARNPSPETWRNLSAVHAQLGETELAGQARMEWTRVSEQLNREHPEVTTAPNGVTVKWVDKQTFERGSRELGPRPPVQPPTENRLQTAVRPRRRTSTW